MDVREFEQRIAGGREVDLEMSAVADEGQAILLNLEKRPYKSTLGLLKKVIEDEPADGRLPVYFRMGIIDDEDDNYGVYPEEDTIVHIGYLELTLAKWRRIDNILYSFTPKLCSWDSGRVEPLKREDYIHTIQLQEAGENDEFI